MPNQSLVEVANILRARIIETSHLAKVPHLGSCLSMVDILVALYWNVLRVSPLTANQLDRDRFILSKGHAAPALFQVLAEKSFFDKKLIEKFGQDGSLLGEHPLAHGVPGVEAATGSLGHGLPIGAGLALASQMMSMDNFVYVLMGDGECNEGSVWEAALFAAAQNLDNLVVLIDFNKWQATSRSEEVMAFSSMVDKWTAFGWEACEVDGHDIAGMIDILGKWRSQKGKPRALIAHTIKGKGVSFMEDDNNWHYRIPSKQEVLDAKKELFGMKECYA
jgi:transketolase